MARRCRRGRPPHHWKTTTFLAALRHDRIAAPCVFDGAINGERFRAWIEQALAPTLRPGDLVIMDNLGAHKVQGVREAIEARGARLLYLTPYSPDLNPIEQAFAKLKALLRTAARRTVDALWHASAKPSTPSHPPKVPTTSPTPAMFRLIGNRSSLPPSTSCSAERAQRSTEAQTVPPRCSSAVLVRVHQSWLELGDPGEDDQNHGPNW
jgi:transposase